MRTVVLSIHDVAAETLPGADRLREAVRRRFPAAAVSLLLVPRLHGRPWDAATGRWVRERVGAGDEPVLHGRLHAGPDGADGAEFGTRTDPAAAARTVCAGLADLREEGVHPSGFVAPAYRHPRGLDAGLRTSGLAWWATRGRIRTPRGGTALPSIGLGASTAPRRALSPAAVRVAHRALAGAPALRIDLHPADLDHPRLAREAVALLDRIAAEGRRPVRHADLLLVASG